MPKYNINNRPFILFLPFLVLYIFLVFFNNKGSMEGDELRYYQFAVNLRSGFYSPPSPNINLWNGPGYPLIIYPFVALHLPNIAIPLLNAVFQYLSIIVLFKTLSLFVNNKISIAFSLFWALYYNTYNEITVVLTEPLTSLLIICVAYWTTLYYKFNNKKHLILAGVFLGYLALTKILFGYVLVLMLLMAISMLLIREEKALYKKMIGFSLIALFVTLPYLFYTYQLTGKVFYWGNSGGMSLYWMSSNSDFEFGDWKPASLFNSNYPEPFGRGTGDSLLKENHYADMRIISKYNGVQMDEMYKKLAFRNIKANPIHFMKNCASNVSRMLFDTPYSYTYQRRADVYSILLSSVVLILSVYSLIFSLFNWRTLYFPIKQCLCMVFFYLLLSTFVSAYPRMFDVIVPILLIWIAWATDKSIKINLKGF